MNFLIAAFVYQWFECIVAKVIICPYLYGIVTIGDPTKMYMNWWTNDLNQAVPVPTFDKMTPLYIAGFLQWHYIYSMFVGIVSIGIERMLATYYIQDYESKSRRHIPVFFVIMTHSLTIPFAYFILNNKISFSVAAAACFIAICFMATIFFIVWKVNTRLDKRYKRTGAHYSLGQQFQVKENLRCLKMVKNLIIFVTFFVLASLILLVLLVLNLVPSELEHMMIHVLENSIILNPLVICTVIMISFPAWREEFLSNFPFIQRIHRPKVSTINFSKSSRDNEAEMYFNNLRTAWH